MHRCNAGEVVRRAHVPVHHVGEVVRQAYAPVQHVGEVVRRAHVPVHHVGEVVREPCDRCNTLACGCGGLFSVVLPGRIGIFLPIPQLFR